MESVVTFLQTQNPEAAIAFYRDTMGFNFRRDDGFALVFNMPGAMLRIGKASAVTPAPFTVLGWESADIAADVDGLAAKGVEFTRFPKMGQDGCGIATFPNGDRVAWFKDPDGNVLSLSQHVEN